jgi:hypothetical protein
VTSKLAAIFRMNRLRSRSNERLEPSARIFDTVLPQLV